MTTGSHPDAQDARAAATRLDGLALLSYGTACGTLIAALQPGGHKGEQEAHCRSDLQVVRG